MSEDPEELESGSSSDFSGFSESPADQDDNQISTLQEQLNYEKDARREERFIYIVLLIVLFDVVFFTVMPNFSGPLVLGILELLIVFPIARRLGMEEICEIVQSVIHRIADRGK